MSIENRLKEERIRLGFNQPDFAALAGRTKKTLIDYEKGTTCPDARFLAAIAEEGADVQYILTGIRGLQPAVAEKSSTYTVLNRREAALLDNYRAIADEEDKGAVERTALMAARAGQGETKSGAKKAG